jgi:hypothetical protein
VVSSLAVGWMRVGVVSDHIAPEHRTTSPPQRSACSRVASAGGDASSNPGATVHTAVRRGAAMRPIAIVFEVYGLVRRRSVVAHRLQFASGGASAVLARGQGGTEVCESDRPGRAGRLVSIPLIDAACRVGYAGVGGLRDGALRP